MAKWWTLGIGKKKGAAAPAPAPVPTPSAPPAGEKKRGLLGRLFGKKEKPAEAPPTAPAAPPAPPTGPPPPPAPPTGAPVPEGEQGGLFPAEEVGGEEEEERQFPGNLAVSADGTWKISKTLWDGIMQGILHGEDVKEFILAMENGNLNRAAEMVADAYDETVGALLDAEGSTIRHIGY